MKSEKRKVKREKASPPTPLQWARGVDSENRNEKCFLFIGLIFSVLLRDFDKL
jgi:hypothetical protein